MIKSIEVFVQAAHHFVCLLKIKQQEEDVDQLIYRNFYF